MTTAAPVIKLGVVDARRSNLMRRRQRLADRARVVRFRRGEERAPAVAIHAVLHANGQVAAVEPPLAGVSPHGRGPREATVERGGHARGGQHDERDAERPRRQDRPPAGVRPVSRRDAREDRLGPARRARPAEEVAGVAVVLAAAAPERAPFEAGAALDLGREGPVGGVCGVGGAVPDPAEDVGDVA